MYGVLRFFLLKEGYMFLFSIVSNYLSLEMNQQRLLLVFNPQWSSTRFKDINPKIIEKLGNNTNLYAENSKTYFIILCKSGLGMKNYTTHTSQSA